MAFKLSPEDYEKATHIKKGKVQKIEKSFLLIYINIYKTNILV